jgi:uncharacterized protein YgiM (DUF1202 family)
MFEGSVCLACLGLSHVEKQFVDHTKNISDGNEDLTIAKVLTEAAKLSSSDKATLLQEYGSKIRDESEYHILFDGERHELTFNGNTYVAYNNVASSSNGKWRDGIYTHDYTLDKTNVSTEEQRIYGSVANIVFQYPGRSGMGIHSGRANDKDKLGRSGSEHCTMGCIRTTD